MLKIVTDSCADMEENFAQEHNITVAHLHLQVDGQDFTPGLDIDTDQALTRIAAAQEMPKTSQPTPHAYQQAFQQNNQLNDEALCLTLSSDLSGSFNSANLAAQSSDITVHTHDTRMGSFAEGFQVMLATLLSERGKSVAEIKAALQDYYQKSSIIVILEKYDNAIKSGRVNKYAGKIIEKLNIRGIIEVLEGKVVIVDKARGADKTFQKMLERIAGKAEDFSQMVIGIAHFQNPEMAEKYRSALDEMLHPAKIYMGLISPAIGVYCDKGGLVISVAPNPYTFA